jgi:hypothetical protein
MASTVERRPDGTIIYKAAETRPVPDLDLLSLLFGSQPTRFSLLSERNQPS